MQITATLSYLYIVNPRVGLCPVWLYLVLFFSFFIFFLTTKYKQQLTQNERGIPVYIIQFKRRHCGIKILVVIQFIREQLGGWTCFVRMTNIALMTLQNIREQLRAICLLYTRTCVRWMGCISIFMDSCDVSVYS